MALHGKNRFIILTLMLEKQYQDHFSRQRSLYYPRHANYLDAHLTLFHRLPFETGMLPQLEAFARRPAIVLQVSGIENMGNGVAYTIVSEELLQLHKTMQATWAQGLMARDRQPLWPHITVQHGVTAFKAARLTAALQSTFRPFGMKGTGLCAWHYLQGRWEAAAAYPFSG